MIEDLRQTAAKQIKTAQELIEVAQSTLMKIHPVVQDTEAFRELKGIREKLTEATQKVLRLKV